MTVTPASPPPSAERGPLRRVVSARPSLGQRLRRLWVYRELLLGLVRKELKVKYKNSALGFLWSMLNPALYLVVFYVVFQVVLDNGLPYFTIYLLSGLLVWNLFSTALSGATGSVVANAALVKKVDFPREILPLASVGAALVHFFLQGVVLVGALAVFRYEVSWSYVPLLVPALLALLALAAGLGVLLSALNVYLRDTQHFLELGLLAWFWFTPIVWYYGIAANAGGSKANLVLLNPVTSITLTFQRALYGRLEFTDAAGKVQTILPDYTVAHHLALVGAVGLGGVVLFFVGEYVFGRLEGNFAEEL